MNKIFQYAVPFDQMRPHAVSHIWDIANLPFKKIGELEISDVADAPFEGAVRVNNALTGSAYVKPNSAAIDYGRHYRITETGAVVPVNNYAYGGKNPVYYSKDGSIPTAVMQALKKDLNFG